MKCEILGLGALFIVYNNWKNTVNRICLVLCIELKKDPMCLLFGLRGTPETSMYAYFLCADKCIVEMDRLQASSNSWMAQDYFLFNT